MGKIYHAYCDESCTDKGHQYMALGGILATANDAEAFRTEMRLWRKRTNMKSEMKWTRISDGKLPEYQSYIELGLDWVLRGALRFGSLVIEKSQIDYRTHHDGDKEKAFRRFAYLLVFHSFCPRIQNSDQLALFLDERDGYPLDELRGIMNRALCRRRKFSLPPIRSARWVDSVKSEVMQLADVLTGAVAYHYNGRHTRPGRKSRRIIAELIAQSCGHKDLCVATRHTPFDVWPLQFRQ